MFKIDFCSEPFSQKGKIFNVMIINTTIPTVDMTYFLL